LQSPEIGGHKYRQFADTPLGWKAIGASTPALLGGTSNYFSQLNSKLSDPGYGDFVCTGIADATVAAIEKAAIAEVAGAAREDRVVPECHSVSGVTMRDGSQFVFDWFLNLEIHNPVIFRLDEWQVNSSDGIQFASFRGLDDRPPPPEAQRRQLKELRSTF
jgi:hypothetical protein